MVESQEVLWCDTRRTSEYLDRRTQNKDIWIELFSTVLTMMLFKRRGRMPTDI